jgi:hypothetical protein
MIKERVDVAALLAQVDLVEIVARDVKLKRAGREYSGLCPFHDEGTPSFTVNPAKGFFHCFGCGAHGNAIEWVIRTRGVDFLQACEQLGARNLAPAAMPRPELKVRERDPVWLPISPVPEDAPPLIAEGARRTCAVWNAKRERWTHFEPVATYPYRGLRGELIGYVLRVVFVDRETGRSKKVTPTVTWCVGPSGEGRWCIRPFARPRPLYGLPDLVAKPAAPVLIVEGEKCRDASAGALPMYANLSWPGGGKGLRYVDWSPLIGRDLVLMPDADEPGRHAMLGYRDYHGLLHDGIAQIGWRLGARSIRIIDTSGQPKGWDIADALDPAGDGWSPRQFAAWAATRVVDVEVDYQPGLRAA